MTQKKKTDRANLERGKGLFFLMGLVVALATVFVAFEWGNKEITVGEISTDFVIEEIEDIQITPQDEQQPLPEPEIQQEVVVEELTIVEDDVKVADVQIVSVDDAANKLQQTFTPPAPTQRSREEVAEDHIFEYLEEMPEFPGGQAEMMKWLQKNVQYPPIAAENNIQGRVMVSFVVEPNGSISNVQIARGVDPNLDKEAVRVVKNMPKWKPGMQTGKPVRARFTLPVQFRLQ
ncbi:MAG: TonB family protein [Bacteroidales bacterium]|uniref:energy transducer TonB n=1 Tax=Porphyromonas sp. TaxID=1924944 RepID=UPI00297B0C23|nr:TonB family protein [Porphyromonas sp.]MDD7437513.1 TonB family protein [Bacteroidales bacterium]MDY3066470.1 TonB family protein [Porphyromonas sp.]